MNNSTPVTDEEAIAAIDYAILIGAYDENDEDRMDRAVDAYREAWATDVMLVDAENGTVAWEGTLKDFVDVFEVKDPNVFLKALRAQMIDPFSLVPLFNGCRLHLHDPHAVTGITRVETPEDFHE